MEHFFLSRSRIERGKERLIDKWIKLNKRQNESPFREIQTDNFWKSRFYSENVFAFFFTNENKEFFFVCLADYEPKLSICIRKTIPFFFFFFFFGFVFFSNSPLFSSSSWYLCCVPLRVHPCDVFTNCWML